MKRILGLCIMFLTVQLVSAYEVSVSMYQVNDSTWTFNVCLEENELDFTAFQMDVALEGEAIVPESSLTCDTLMNNHRLMLGTPKDKYRILGFSTASTPFKSQNGSLLTFTVNGNPSTISIDNIQFVEADPTALAGVAASIKKTEGAYDLSGRKVSHHKNGAVFVIDGKKVLVK